MKKLLLLLPLLLVFILAGCVPLEKTTTDGTEDGEPLLADDALHEEKIGISYTDTIKGFALTLPETWAGFDVRTENVNMGDDVTSQTFYFGFETWDDIFAISTIDKQDYEKLTEAPKATKLGENNKYMFFGSSSQDLIDPKLEDRFMEISDIFETFELK